MITTPLLETKYKTQKKLAEDTQYDIEKYFSHIRRLVCETEAQYGVQFQYGALPDTEVEPLITEAKNP